MNNEIFFFFYNLAHRSDFFDTVITFSAVYFIYIVIISALLFSFYRLKSWRDLFLVCFSGGVAWILAKILKILIHTPRPFDVFPEVEPLFFETGYAFPSGHSMVAAAIAGALFFTHKKAGYVFMFFALIVGLARITAGVHFPIDILGGFILGALISYLSVYFSKYLR